MSLPRVRLGLDLYPVESSWGDLRDVAVRADALGYESLWTWDHLYGHDNPRQTIFEGWTSIAAIGALTSRASVGLLVGANTLRNPAIVAKMAVTLDHITGGRAVLGLGSGWRPREHRDHGIAFGSRPGERLIWLGEALQLIRGLLRGETVSSPPGGHYAFADASHRPLPVGGPGELPILIGGGGERRTLPLVAAYADIWHHRGSVRSLREKLEVLHEACGAIGRDPAEIELAFGPQVVIRSDARLALRTLESSYRRLGLVFNGDPDEAWFGEPQAIADRMFPYLELGFTHFVAGLPAPHDLETVDGLIEVQQLLAHA